MTDLIEALEAAEVGSRDLDAEIWLEVTPGATRKQSSYIHKATGKECLIDETRNPEGRLIIVPHYTTSIDAALELLPEGWRVARMVQCSYQEPLWQVELFRRLPAGDTTDIVAAPTPVLALCIACLKARTGG